MVVEMKVVVYDGVVDVIKFDEMLERSSSFLWSLFDVVDLDGREGDVRFFGG